MIENAYNNSVLKSYGEINSGYVDFELILRQLDKGEIYPCVGYPAIGKNNIALKFIEEIERNKSKKVIYFSIDNGTVIPKLDQIEEVNCLEIKDICKICKEWPSQIDLVIVEDMQQAVTLEDIDKQREFLSELKALASDIDCVMLILMEPSLRKS